MLDEISILIKYVVVVKTDVLSCLTSNMNNKGHSIIYWRENKENKKYIVKKKDSFSLEQQKYKNPISKHDLPCIYFQNLGPHKSPLHRVWFIIYWNILVFMRSSLQERMEWCTRVAASHNRFDIVTLNLYCMVMESNHTNHELVLKR